MPIYEYRCQACGHELEAMQKITADPLTHCPACENDELKRLISQTSFVLKGSGWYVTDYGRGKGGGNGSSGGNGGSGGNGSNGKGESTAATTESSAEKSTAAKDTKSEGSSSKPSAASASS